MKKIVFITGATSGFGEACAHKFAAENYHLIINGRRVERLQSLKEKIRDQYNVNCYILPFDVQNQAEVFDSIGSLPNEWQSVNVLINNAGLALGRDLFEEAMKTGI